ncbi:uncharacterized protein LOC143294047 [Babylonia areolata]|uniref:uncharacterized protein LOC143294047 n=1 Tax=Babylonia areolata TaxID=304850 RepID=UPI003FD5304B
METTASKRCAAAFYVFLLAFLWNVQGVTADVYSLWYFWFCFFIFIFILMVLLSVCRQKYRQRMEVVAPQKTVVVHHHQQQQHPPPPPLPPQYNTAYPPPPPPPPMQPQYPPPSDPAYPPGYGMPVMPSTPVDPFQKAAGAQA